MNKPLMAKATAVWLVDNTTLTFRQVAEFCGMHELEVQGIADGDVATGVKGFDPVSNNQLDQVEIELAGDVGQVGRGTRQRWPRDAREAQCQRRHDGRQRQRRHIV